MAATITLKRKCYSDDEKKKGMGTGTKILAGLTAGGVALAGAKYGALGNNAMRWSNNLLGKTGAYASKMGMNKIGTGMMNSGQKGLAEAEGNITFKNMLNNAPKETIEAISKSSTKAGETAAQTARNNWNNIANSTSKAAS